MGSGRTSTAVWLVLDSGCASPAAGSGSVPWASGIDSNQSESTIIY